MRINSDYVQVTIGLSILSITKISLLPFTAYATVKMSTGRPMNTKLLKLVPPSETWLYRNKEAIESVRRGLKDASEGRISKLNLDEL